MKDASLTAKEWLHMRAKVAQAISISGSSQQPHTRNQIAENLMSSGYIDIPFVLNEIRAAETSTEETGDAK